MFEIKDGCLLRIFVGESDRWQGHPAYSAIVARARESHLAGATVLRGPMGFGAASRLHTASVLRMSDDLPIVIEIVDSREKIEAFLPELETILKSGLITLERVEVFRYGKNPDSPRESADSGGET
jgi:PII-like signaling protein